ncbi:DUF454 family protein [Candidatus Parcubacteria bacterium]|nr:DUF454 family protein [Candidatus Parcubacteria bacterium]
MIKHVKRTLLLVLGVLFLILGVIGLFLPFLQGVLFLAIGLLIISICLPQVREWMMVHTRKYPKLHDRVEKLDEWLRNKIGEI